MSEHRVSPKLLAVLGMCVVLAVWMAARPLLDGASDEGGDGFGEPADLSFTAETPPDLVTRWEPPPAPRNPFAPIDLGFAAEEGPDLEPRAGGLQLDVLIDLAGESAAARESAGAAGSGPVGPGATD